MLDEQDKEKNELNNSFNNEEKDDQEIEFINDYQDDFNTLLSEQDETVNSEDKNVESNNESNLESDSEQDNRFDSVKDKLSKILKSSNIEIVDENAGDEYDLDEKTEAEKQQEQDYDSLKALFGDNKNNKQELTLSIDEFDYTYVGQFVDEFDFAHIKNIKHIKIHKKHSKKFKLIVASIAVILAAGIAGLTSYLLLREKPVTLQSVALSQNKNSYYIGQKFSYKNLKFIATYSDGSTKEIKISDNPDKYLSNVIGNVERNGSEVIFVGGSGADLTFTYEGYNIKYTVDILSKNKTGLSVIYSDGLFNLNMGQYITEDYLKVFCLYDNYKPEKLNLNDRDISIFVGYGNFSGEVDLNNLHKLSADNNGWLIDINIKNSVLIITYGNDISGYVRSKNIAEISNSGLI